MHSDDGRPWMPSAVVDYGRQCLATTKGGRRCLRKPLLRWSFCALHLSKSDAADWNTLTEAEKNQKREDKKAFALGKKDQAIALHQTNGTRPKSYWKQYWVICRPVFVKYSDSK